MLSIEIDVENMKAWIAMNGHHEAKSRELIILKDKLEQSSIATEDRSHQIQIESQLRNQSNCDLGETLTPQDLDERIRGLEDI